LAILNGLQEKKLEHYIDQFDSGHDADQPHGLSVYVLARHQHNVKQFLGDTKKTSATLSATSGRTVSTRQRGVFRLKDRRQKFLSAILSATNVGKCEQQETLITYLIFKCGNVKTWRYKLNQQRFMLL